MAEIRAVKIGLSTRLANGAKVFGVLGESGEHTCFELTAPDGVVTRFALSASSLSAMVDIGVKLRERADSLQATEVPSKCEFPVCAVHHICTRNCERNAGVKEADKC